MRTLVDFTCVHFLTSCYAHDSTMRRTPSPLPLRSEQSVRDVVVCVVDLGWTPHSPACACQPQERVMGMLGVRRAGAPKESEGTGCGESEEASLSWKPLTC